MLWEPPVTSISRLRVNNPRIRVEYLFHGCRPQNCTQRTEPVGRWVILDGLSSPRQHRESLVRPPQPLGPRDKGYKPHVSKDGRTSRSAFGLKTTTPDSHTSPHTDIPTIQSNHQKLRKRMPMNAESLVGSLRRTSSTNRP